MHGRLSLLMGWGCFSILDFTVLALVEKRSDLREVVKWTVE